MQLINHPTNQPLQPSITWCVYFFVGVLLAVVCHDVCTAMASALHVPNFLSTPHYLLVSYLCKLPALSHRYGSVIFINVASSSVRDHWTDLLKSFIKSKEAGTAVGSSGQAAGWLRLDGEAAGTHIHMPGSGGLVGRSQS